MHDPCSGHIQRHRWSRNVGDRYVADRREAAREIGAAEQRGQPGHEPWRTRNRHVHPEHRLELPHHRLGRLGGGMDRLKRAGRSSMSVARSTRTIDTWLFIALSPSARRLTGTIAMSASLGSRPRSCRKRCSARLHIAITMVLTVPPTRLPSPLMSVSGNDSVLYER